MARGTTPIAVRFRALFLAPLLIIFSAGLARAQSTCGTTEWALTAGQNINVGTVTVSNDLNQLLVTYALTAPGSTLGGLHAWAGSDLAAIPKNKQGIPVPGHFPYAADATGLSTFTFAIPLTALQIPDATAGCGTPLFVVTHAEVSLLAPDGTTSQESAFGGPIPAGGPRWWFYGVYPVCCDFGGTTEPN